MIDRKALEEILKKHVGEMEESVTVELHLFNSEAASNITMVTSLDQCSRARPLIQTK